MADRKTVDDFFRGYGFNISEEPRMTDREARQYHHQIGAASDSPRLSTISALVVIFTLSVGLWGMIWLLMAAIVSAWVQPWL